MSKKKDVSMLVSALGVLMGIITALFAAIKKKGGLDEDFYRLATPEGENLIEKIADIIVQTGRKAKCVFPVWKTIKLGTDLKLADDFRKALKANGHRIDDWGNDILGKPAFTTADKETEIDLAVVSNAELGFKEGACVKDTYKRALELGLVLCPNEVGPQLRLQYTNQPMGEWLLVAMDPIKNSGGGLGVFGVARYVDGSWLDGCRGHPDYRWYAVSRFVFALPRK
ncbi:MAG: hypothetical protein AAB757_01345 [Patescibacteria group bacterium]